MLGGEESVRMIDLRRIAGYRKGDTAVYIRKSTPCIRSFLLLAALHVCLYDDQEIAIIITQMLSLSGLSERFPAAAQQMEKLVNVLQPRTNAFLEDVAECKMRVLSAAAEESDIQESEAACKKLEPKKLAGLLVHAFRPISTTSTKLDGSKRKDSTNCDSVELRGATGYFELATILLWLAPMRVALSLRYSTEHPYCRKYAIGNGECPLILQISSEIIQEKQSGSGSGWTRIPWSSVKSIAKDALGWVGVAKPLLKGHASLFGGAALSAAQRLFA